MSFVDSMIRMRMSEQQANVDASRSQRAQVRCATVLRVHLISFPFFRLFVRIQRMVSVLFANRYEIMPKWEKKTHTRARYLQTGSLRLTDVRDPSHHTTYNTHARVCILTILKDYIAAAYVCTVPTRFAYNKCVHGANKHQFYYHKQNIYKCSRRFGALDFGPRKDNEQYE